MRPDATPTPVEASGETTGAAKPPNAVERGSEAWRYRSMEEIVATLKPSLAVLRRWLWEKRSTIAGRSKVMECVILSWPDSTTQGDIARYIAEEEKFRLFVRGIFLQILEANGRAPVELAEQVISYKMESLIQSLQDLQ